MILSDTAIIAAMRSGDIVIDPFWIDQLGGNSYDVRLASVLLVYETEANALTAGGWSSNIIGPELCGSYETQTTPEARPFVPLDSSTEPSVIKVEITDTGIILVPGILYLASTIEYTETHKYVPYLDGKSGVGRLGISVHATAGRGDVGFCGHWTMEISVVEPVRVYAGMPIGQLTYHAVEGKVQRRYDTKPGASYTDARDPLPQASRLWRKLGRS